jgi:adenylate cyclase class IV
MAKMKEIESKWDALKLDRVFFNNKISQYFHKSKIRHTFLYAAGFDYYYESCNGYVARHRHGADVNELTVKARLSDQSIKVRKEGNLHLAQNTPVTEVKESLELMGFNLSFSIYKDCDIYFIEEEGAEISIVWYAVDRPKSKMKRRYFFEIEVQNAPEKKSLKLLKKWTKIAYSLFHLSDEDLIHDSLYEIYSGKRYKTVKRK